MEGEGLGREVERERGTYNELVRELIRAKRRRRGARMGPHHASSPALSVVGELPANIHPTFGVCLFFQSPVRLLTGMRVSLLFSHISFILLTLGSYVPLNARR